MRRGQGRQGKVKDITNLQQMLDKIQGSADGDERVSLGTVVEAVGSRSFGPLLLLAGLIMTSPVSAVPTVPTTMGLLVLLIAGQLLLGREHFWFPRKLLERTVERGKIQKTVKFLRPPARFIDRIIHPRLQGVLNGVGIYAIAILCVIIALCAPMMELVPFSIHGAGIALTAFGLALIAKDGLVALLAFGTAAGSLGTLVYNLVT